MMLNGGNKFDEWFSLSVIKDCILPLFRKMFLDCTDNLYKKQLYTRIIHHLKQFLQLYSEIYYIERKDNKPIKDNEIQMLLNLNGEFLVFPEMT